MLPSLLTYPEPSPPFCGSTAWAVHAVTASAAAPRVAARAARVPRTRVERVRAAIGSRPVRTLPAGQPRRLAVLDGDEQVAAVDERRNARERTLPAVGPVPEPAPFEGPPGDPDR